MVMLSRLLLVGAILFSSASAAFPDSQAGPPPPVMAPNAAALRHSMSPTRAIGLETLDLGKMIQDKGSPQADRSVGNHPLMLGGVVHAHGIGTRARSLFKIDLKSAAERFTAVVGVDDEQQGQGAAIFEVWVDGRRAADTGVRHGGDPPLPLSVDLTGATSMTLVVEHGHNSYFNDDADWADARLTLLPGSPAVPEAASLPPQRGAMTRDFPPLASSASPDPAIHGPRVVGATPGRPFLFLIPATGSGPLTFSARSLPAGLRLDPNTGILSGALQRSGTTVVELQVRGPGGAARRRLTIVGGEHKLALTPPLGWNSWNAWGTGVDAEKVRQASDWLVKSGLAAHGYQYVNIDAGWQGQRDASGEIQPNEKFKDIAPLADYVHHKGLKLGIYSSPGPWTCGQGRYPGSYSHEQQDADTYARWGVDYLKYDWCSYSPPDNSLAELQKPYRVMRAALDNVPRDIVYSLSQYGAGDVWGWGAAVGGNCWRTTGDIADLWWSIDQIGFSQDGLERYAGPGHWNDADMLVVGRLGLAGTFRQSMLTPDEQLTHLTLWSLLAAPLLIGCDLSQLDPWTLDLLSNDEVLDVDQDPLGRQAGRRSLDGWGEVWARPLWDGTVAAGLFNRGSAPTAVSAPWPALGLKGRQAVRDLWQQKDLGVFDSAFAAVVPAHGAILVRIGRPTPTS